MRGHPQGARHLSSGPEGNLISMGFPPGRQLLQPDPRDERESSWPAAVAYNLPYFLETSTENIANGNHMFMGEWGGLGNQS